MIDERVDRPAYVRFELRPVEDKASSLREGRYVAKDEEYALITPPYSKDCVVMKVQSWRETNQKNLRDGRIPQKYFDFWEESYKRWRAGNEAPLDGTPIRGWGIISPAQQETLARSMILTVEDLANITDSGIKAIGIGGMDLRNKAKAWLKSMQDNGGATMEIAALKRANETLNEHIIALSSKLELLTSAKTEVYGDNIATGSITVDDILDDEVVPKQAVVANVVAAKRRGRPPKHMRA